MQNNKPDKQPEIRILPMPADTNAAGDIFGGWLMSQLDIAGSIAAHRYVGHRVVTVAVNELIFIKPVLVGDVVSIYSRIIHVGTSSLRVALEVYSERGRGKQPAEQVAKAEITYVSVDSNRKPLAIDKPAGDLGL